MKVLRLRAHHVMRLDDIDLDLSGHNLYLVGGKNAQGKTSTLTSLLMALCPKKKMDWPKTPLMEGESEGWIKVDLSGNAAMGDANGFTAELHFRRKRSGVVADEFRLLDSTGEEAPNPRALLEELYKFRAFDPLEFDRMKAKERRLVLAELVGLDLEKYQKDRKELYDERTIINRAVKEKESLWRAMPVHSDVPDKPVEISALLKRKEDWNSRQAERANMENDRKDAMRDRDSANKRSQEIQEEIKALQAKLKHSQADAMEAETKVSKANKWLSEHLPTEDGAALDKAIRDVESTNAKARENAERLNVAAQLSKVEKESKAKTAAMETLDKEQEEKLKKANWPVPGLGIDEEGVTLHNLDWDSASRAERIEASIRIGMAMNPTLRLFVCQNGSDLDNETLKALQTVLKNSDYQLVCEIVTRNSQDESECSVVIEDGKEKP